MIFNNSFHVKDFNSILIAGAGGITGQHYSRLLLHHNKTVFAYDENPHVSYPPELINHSKFRLVTDAILDKKKFFDRIDVISLSPGFPLQKELFSKCKELSKPIFSELEYCFPYLQDYVWVGITGTDGKSSTTTFLTHLLNVAGLSAIACGNIGIPFSKLVYEQEQINSHKWDVLVAELSSYQLELSRNLALDCGILLNIAHDHLNRYPTYAEYGQVKWKIAGCIKEQQKFFISKDLSNHIVYNKIQTHPITIVPIDTDLLSSPLFKWTRHHTSHLLHTPDSDVNLDHTFTMAKHDLGNSLFALEACQFISEHIKHPQKIDMLRSLQDALHTLPRLAHRFEVFSHYKNIDFIDDSKATTIQAVCKAIDSIEGQFYMFLGGQGKGTSYWQLAKILSQKDAYIFLFGAEKDKLRISLSKESNHIVGTFFDLAQAFKAAWEHVQTNPIFFHQLTERITFILSPGCTSWDQYTSFKKRGEHFKRLVIDTLQDIHNKNLHPPQT